jgi:protein SCO1
MGRWRSPGNPQRRSLASWGGLASLAIIVTMPSTGIKAHDHHAQKKEIRTEQIQGRRIPDVLMTDQDGRAVRFLSDVLQQRTAVISFIYTSCRTTCPLIGATVAAVTEHLQKDNTNLAIVSVSVDPNYDTPARLLAWRKEYGDFPQWILLTGSKREVDPLLRALGAYSANLEDHQNILLVGPDAAGKWTRMDSLTEWQKVAAAARAAAASGDK